MSNKTLEGMARAHWDEWLEDRTGPKTILTKTDIAAMKAVLLWLADNVSDEMCYRAGKIYQTEDLDAKKYISAALRAAAGSALEAKP